MKIPVWGGEPSLDDLLGDEIMDRVLRTSGMDAPTLRRSLAKLAARLAGCAWPARSDGGCRRAGFC